MYSIGTRFAVSVVPIMYMGESLIEEIYRYLDDKELVVNVRQLKIHEDLLRVDMSMKLGNGEFGIIYKGLLAVDDAWRSVAVKVIKG